MNPHGELTEQAIEDLAALVDQQWGDLMRRPDHSTYRSAPVNQESADADPHSRVPADAPLQRAILESAVKEPFGSFWTRFLSNLRRDLCLPGGLLHDQWQRYKNLERKSAVRISYGWLAAMGVPTGSLAPATVAATVYLLTVLANVGIETLCDACRSSDRADQGNDPVS